MEIIGLTGGSGAGKSEVSRYMQSRYGVVHIDGDAVARHVTDTRRECLDELAAHFGLGILNPDGTLNRKALAALAFASGEETVALNRITHKYITEEINCQIERSRAAGAPAVAVDGAAIIESGTARDCDALVVVTAPYARRLKAVMARDGIDEAQARRRLDAQKPDAWYTSHADYTIENIGTLEELQRQVDAVMNGILKPED